MRRYAVSTAAEEPTKPARPDHTITFTVDAEPVTTSESELTPDAILRLAGLDPTSHYLVQVDGRHQTSYERHGDEPIRVHEHEVFVSVSTGPTPVS
jgi:hypothetical protein